MTYVWLIVGFILLIKGADLFVDGSAGIAKLLKVPSVIIGLTIVAMGTSMPEASVSITAGLAGNNELALSNVIGSNIFNLLVACGACALIHPLTAQKDITERDLPFNFIISILLLVFMLDGLIQRFNGAVLLVIMLLYMLYLIKSALKNRTAETDEDKLPLWKCLIFILVGIVAIVFGGDLVVKNASEIAVRFGMSDNLVGLTIVAIGTSLPELVTSLTAAKKGEHELALGNAVGSCVFNTLFILGASSVLTPIAVNGENIIDMAFCIITTVFITFSCRKKNMLSRSIGAVCVLSYILYTAYIILRNYYI